MQTFVDNIAKSKDIGTNLELTDHMQVCYIL